MDFFFFFWGGGGGGGEEENNLVPRISTLLVPRSLKGETLGTRLGTKMNELIWAAK